MVKRISITPSAGSALLRTRQVNPAQQAQAGGAIANPGALVHPLDAPGNAAGAHHPDQHCVQAQDSQARARVARSHRQRILAGLPGAVGSASVSAAATPMTQEEVIKAWTLWAQTRHSPSSERRETATERVIACIRGEGENPSSLNLSELGLKGELPPLPEHLTRLEMVDNPGVTSLASIPASLSKLIIIRCGLEHLPPFPQGSRLELVNFNQNPRLKTISQIPPSVLVFNAGGCGFRELPAFHPESQLQELNINGNRELRTVPVLPASLMRMQVEHCGLREIPPFPEECELQELSVKGNPQLHIVPRLPRSLLQLEAQRCGLKELPLFAEEGQLQVLDVSSNVSLKALTLLPASLRQLNACYCGLKQISDFPENSQLEQLFLAGNHLKRIPPLPQWLQSLWLDGNRSLQSLPDFPLSLTRVAACGCAFKALPELGVGVQQANFSGNQIRTLTQRIQPSVIKLNLTYNPIAQLPEWLSHLSSQAELLFSRYHVTDVVRSALVEHLVSARVTGAGPRITFDAAGTVNPSRPIEESLPRTLGVAAGAWMDSAIDVEASQKTWATFAQEDGSQDFANFLDRLSLTINHVTLATRGPFRQGVRQLLDDMARSPELRADCFAICVTATERCEDRVTLSYQNMAVPRLAEAVRRGDFDANEALPGFIDQIRSLYRRDVLTEIANSKVQQLEVISQRPGIDRHRAVDPVEVHLAFQVGLNQALDLQLDAQQMRYPGASRVTKADLEAAQSEVRQRENQGFASHLINHSGPWSLLMNKQNPDLHTQMAQAKHSAIEPERFAPAMSAHLAKLGLPDDADTVREAGRIVSDELTLFVQRPLVEQFLREKGNDPAALLGPRWLGGSA